jgi:hypothetical protein
MLSSIILNVIMLNIIMLNVIVLNVMVHITKHKMCHLNYFNMDYRCKITILLLCLSLNNLCFSSLTNNKMALCHYTECLLLLSVKIKFIILNVIMLSVTIKSIILNVIMLSAIMLNIGWGDYSSTDLSLTDFLLTDNLSTDNSSTYLLTWLLTG